MAQKTDLIEEVSVRIGGVVQGVGFRPYVARLAAQYGICGYVRNETGDVFVLAQGTPEKVRAFLGAIESDPPSEAAIRSVSAEFHGEPSFVFPRFSIAESLAGDPHTPIPSPDIAICEHCLRELGQAGNERVHNAFISCTDCGPRFSIMEELPYDRASTSMGEFPLCPRCASQYEDPLDRRCHAQTICCNDCGPRLFYMSRDGETTGVDGFTEAVGALTSGGIVAVKGIGGFHLAASPFDDGTLSLLRELKGREQKPFAVMFPDLDSLREQCLLSAQEEALITSKARPIVLLERCGSALSPLVCGNSRFVGAFLPYAPLQHLLLAQTGPLVMTSANHSSLPIVKDDEEMLAFFRKNPSLSGVLTHNREIVRRLDDSVAAVVLQEPQYIRRARGVVPLPVTAPVPEGPAVLACGPHQKNTFCLSRGNDFFLSGENGDLTSRETAAAYRESVQDYENILRITPALVACDAHPRYESTAFAHSLGLPVIAVQHHHAHIASVMAEHSLTGELIGVALDGTGYGTDHTSWGGEFLVASERGFHRAAHLKSVKMAGADESVKEAWKTAACLRFDAGLEARDEREAILYAALTHDIGVYRTSGMGRLFDGVSSLLGVCHTSDYDGQSAVELEHAAARCDRGSGEMLLPYGIVETPEALIFDSAPLIRMLVEEREQGFGAELLAMRFHKTIADLIHEGCVRIRARSGLRRVALSGGVFYNRILLEETVSLLLRDGFTVFRNEKIPSGDGGISLGQAYLARWAAAEKEDHKLCVSQQPES